MLGLVQYSGLILYAVSTFNVTNGALLRGNDRSASLLNPHLTNRDYIFFIYSVTGRIDT